MRNTVAGFTLIACGLMGRPTGAQAAEPALDFEFFKARVQPVFLAKRPGHARCVSCHMVEPGRNPRPALATLAAGSSVWSDEASRRNFAQFAEVVVPGSPKSKLLLHPLAEAAGGDASHAGGKHFASQEDPEWRILKAWIMGAKLTPTPAADRARILQTNSAGDNIHIINPATNEVVGEIAGIELSHGVAVSPDSTRLYVSTEGARTVDVVDGRTFEVIKRIPLSGRPNNISISRDGRRVYVAIRTAPGGVDVIDTLSLEKAKTIQTGMPIHNAYVTPDGKHVLAGSVEGNAVQVIDAATETLAWSIPMDLGVRPIAMSTNPDGSTKWLFVQLNDFNGFVVVDFAARKEIKRFPFPPIGPGRTLVPTRGEVAHGLAVTPDGRTLMVSSRINAALYAYSLPDLQLTGTAELGGRGANWVTISPDGTRAYVSNVLTDDVSVVDIKSVKEIVRIPVGSGPKRNVLWMLP